jgi:hypothetical protein
MVGLSVAVEVPSLIANSIAPQPPMKLITRLLVVPRLIRRVIPHNFVRVEGVFHAPLSIKDVVKRESKNIGR